MPSEDKSNEYPKYFYASKKHILWELFFIFLIPMLLLVMSVLLFFHVIGNENHKEGSLVILLVALGFAIALGLVTRVHRYWFQWHHDGPIIKLEPEGITFYEWSEKPVPHKLLHKPFRVFASGYTNIMGLPVIISASKSELQELGYPPIWRGPFQVLYGHGGARWVKAPLPGGHHTIRAEYYKLHPPK